MHIPIDSLSTFALDIPDGIDLPQITTSTAAGIGVAILGNILISLALNCQKLAHRRLETERQTKAQELRRPKPHRSTSAPTGRVSGERPHQPLSTTHSTPLAAVAVLETDPLLEDSEESLDHTQPQTPTQATPNPSRRWLFSHYNPARDADRSHLAGTHALMPVDVVPLRSDSSSQQYARNSKEELHDGNESDYLKSKLWYVRI